MTSMRRVGALGLLLGVPAGVVAACGGGGSNADTHGTGTGGAASSSHGTASTMTAGGGHAGSGGSVLHDGGPGCTQSSQCDGGTCVGGACCAASDACGAACCGTGEVCLFEGCVTPGKPCHIASDCGPGQYCETALGGGSDGGILDAGADVVCTEAVPIAGRCLPLPPICPDGGAPDGGDAGSCVEDCTYLPPFAQLDPVVKWQWGPKAEQFPDFTDVWSTPVVGRLYDSNCDGKLDELDTPDVIFVAGRNIDMNTGVGTNCQDMTTDPMGPTACHTGVLRMLDGRTGKEIWSLDKASPTSVGFSGMSLAIGDLDNDGRADIAAVTGEGFVVMIDGAGTVKRTSDKPIPNADLGHDVFGWGGGLAIADLDGDGFPEIVYGATVYTTKGGGITQSQAFGIAAPAGGQGGPSSDEFLSTMAALDPADPHLELLAGNTVYRADGSIKWRRADLPDGFTATGDFDKNGTVEVVLVGVAAGAGTGAVWILDGATGKTVLGPVSVPGTGTGGAPTVADFDGNGFPEIGIAKATQYAVMKPNFVTKTIDVLWSDANHDFSSSVTGSSVFDFEGQNHPAVVYGDECFLWVFDGKTGNVRFSTPHTSFTATEASLVADVDGDGHAEIVMVSNGADPSVNGWKCNEAPWNTAVAGVHPAWAPPPGGPAYRGIVVYGDKANSWVGTRTLWSEHTYHVSNICDDTDSACDPPNVYGSIPKVEKANWSVPWLNNFRQNVQDKGIFNAPDPTPALTIACTTPLTAEISLRNVGLAALPAGVEVGVYRHTAKVDTLLAKTATTHPLFPSQTEQLPLALPASATTSETYVAKVIIDPNNPTFHECRSSNNESPPTTVSCNGLK